MNTYDETYKQLHIVRATIKENGTPMFLFKYKNKWMLSTKYDFANDKVQFGEMTYAELFLQIINQSLDTFANTLLNQFEEKNCIITFCFEMCSQYNKIIREYKFPTLFLIGAFTNADNINNNSREIQIPKSISLPLNVCHTNEIHFEPNITCTQITEKITELSIDDYSFEGIVLETNFGKIKVKNLYYTIQHNLKYKGWSECTALIIVPLILDKMHTQIFQNVSKALNDPIFDYEISERVHYYINRIEREYETLLILVTQLSEMNLDCLKYNTILSTFYPTIAKTWGSLFFDIYKDIQHIKKNIVNYLIKNLSCI